MGPYLLKSNLMPMNVNDRGMLDFYQSLPEKKVVLPSEVSDIPDIIFYFCDEDSEHSRHSFSRIPAADVLVTNPGE